MSNWESKIRPISNANDGWEAKIRPVAVEEPTIAEEPAPPKTKNHTAKYLTQQAVKTALTLPDIPQHLASFASRFSPLRAASNVAHKGAGYFLDKTGLMERPGVRERFEESRPLAYTPKWLPSEATLKIPKHFGYDVNALQPENAAERYGGKAIEWGIPSALGGIGGMAGRVAMGAGLGMGAQGLEDAGVPPEAAALMAGFSPLAYGPVKSAVKAISKKAIDTVHPIRSGQTKAAKKVAQMVGEENIPGVLEKLNASKVTEGPVKDYMDTTAQRTLNPNLALTEEALTGTLREPGLPSLTERKAAQYDAIQKSLEELNPESAAGAQAAQEHVRGKIQERIRPFTERMLPEEAGEALRGGLETALDKAVKQRASKAKPEYESLKEIKETVHPKGTLKLISEFKEQLPPKSQYKGVLNKAENLITGKHLTAEEKAVLIKLPEEHHAAFYEPLKVPVLNEAISELKSDAAIARKAGDYKKEFYLNKITASLDNELEHIPKVKEVRANYRAESKQVNAIREHPVLGKLLEKSDYDSHYVVPESGIPHKIINSSAGSISLADDLAKVIGHDAKAMKGIEGHINGLIMDAIVDSKGEINLAGINQFKKQYPGAFKLYKNLDTKLDNLSNAKAFTNKASAELFADNGKHYSDMARIATGSAPERVVPDLFQSKNAATKIKAWKQELMSDKTGDALAGGQREVIKYVTEHAQSPHKFNQFYGKNIKVLKEFFDADQLKVLEEINNKFASQKKVQNIAKTSGSPTAAREDIKKALERSKFTTILDTVATPLGIAGVSYTFGHASLPKAIAFGAGRVVQKLWSEARHASFQKTLQQILLDPNYAKVMLQPFDKAGIAAANKHAQLYYKAKYKGFPVNSVVSAQKYHEKDKEE